MDTQPVRRLRRLLGTRWPLIQAPMAGVQGHALAAAISRAGGLGSLPAAMLTPAALRDELAALCDALGGPGDDCRLPFNLNFFCHAPPAADDARERRWRERLAGYFAEFGLDTSAVAGGSGREPFSTALAELIEPLQPPIVSFHFGLPQPELLARVKAWGAVVLSSATTVDEARWLEARGVDAVIAQGLEAGGHRGHFLSDDLTLQQGTFALVRQVVEAVDVPVIAAGGIADAPGIAAALALGAAGVQLGTVWLLCDEATTGALHRDALAAQGPAHTALTNLFSGRPARGIVNRLMRECGPLSDDAPAFPLAAAALAPLRAAAEARGLADFTPLWAGQNTRGCRAIGATELVRQLACGFDAG
jgi:nitronate monooxygenase